ncbi:MAG: cytochrome c maturation protein CcmE [Deltaproteobacteria bacterium]|nr:cytochrome c maturation protein CcmE [Deltaproteobacteria bacterium]MCB9785460.1 cytochrome c maturation protein CcmE [Deltaproteobacteria bacterium]
MQPRLFIVIAVLIAAGGLAWLAFGNLGENLVYYWSPTELVEAGPKGVGASVRLGGQVKEGSVRWDTSRTDLHFVVTDNGHDVQVHATAVPPAMFREGIGVVVEGKLTEAGVFESDRLMVKHGNEYQPPKEGEKPDMEAMSRTLAPSESP